MAARTVYWWYVERQFEVVRGSRPAPGARPVRAAQVERDATVGRGEGKLLVRPAPFGGSPPEGKEARHVRDHDRPAPAGPPSRPLGRVAPARGSAGARRGRGDLPARA